MRLSPRYLLDSLSIGCSVPSCINILGIEKSTQMCAKSQLYILSIYPPPIGLRDVLRPSYCKWCSKNGTKFAPPHFCNHTSQSYAVFNRMSNNKLLTRQKPVDVRMQQLNMLRVCSWQVNYSTTTLTATYFIINS